MIAFSNIWECEPINVFVPIVQVLQGMSELLRDDTVERTAIG